MKETIRQASNTTEVVKAELFLEIKDELHGNSKPIGMLHIERTIEVTELTENILIKDR